MYSYNKSAYIPLVSSLYLFNFTYRHHMEINVVSVHGSGLDSSLN